MRFVLVLVEIEMWLRPPHEEPDPTRRDQKRILVIVIGGLGDCLLFDPLFRRLREHWPGARVDVLTGNCFHDLWDAMDPIDDVIYVPLPGNKKAYRTRVRVLRTIRRNRYDIVAQGIGMVRQRGFNAVLTALVADASRAPIRIGRDRTGRCFGLIPKGLRPFKGPLVSEEARDRLPATTGRPNPHLTHVIDPLPAHARPYHVSSRVFAPLGVPYFRRSDEPKLRPRPKLETWARSLLQSQWGATHEIVVGLSLEVTKDLKSWPAERFLAIVEKGIADGLRFVLLGLHRTARDSPFAQVPREHLFDLTARTSLGEMIAIIDQCDVFLSPDSGPSHIAQACGVPSVVLFGPSNQAEFGPTNRDLHTLIASDEDLPCRPCVFGPCVLPESCMHHIGTERVWQALASQVDTLRKQQLSARGDLTPA